MSLLPSFVRPRARRVDATVRYNLSAQLLSCGLAENAGADRSLKDQIAEGARQMRYQPENIRILGMVLRFPVLLFERRRCLSRDRSTIAAAPAVHVHDWASAVKPCKTVSNPARRRDPAARKISCTQHAN